MRARPANPRRGVAVRWAQGAAGEMHVGMH